MKEMIIALTITITLMIMIMIVISSDILNVSYIELRI